MPGKRNHLLSSGTLCTLFLPTLITCISFPPSSLEQGPDKLGILETTTEDINNFHTPDNRLRVCGQRLTLEIHSICNVGYYTPGKEPGLPTILDPQRNRIHHSLNDMRSNEMRTNEVRYHREREHSNEINIPTRVSRGVIEECCRKRNGNSEAEMNATTTVSPLLHLLQKRTSATLQEGEITTTSSRKKYRKDESDVVENCVHCGGKKKEDKKGSDSSVPSDCRKSRGRKSRRLKLKLRRKDESQSLLLPLLLQLLWDWEKMGNSNSQRGTRNFFPPVLPDPLSPTRRQRPGSSGGGRTITAREVTGRANYQNSSPFSKSHLKPTSDETNRDNQDMDKSSSSESMEKSSSSAGDFGPRRQNKVKTHGAQMVVTEEPLKNVFAIPAGTNADFFTL